MRIRYRVNQFWNALSQKPDSTGLARAGQILSPELIDLFLQLQPSEQAHSLHLLSQLESQGNANQELLAAALLHDVGKVRFPLRTWERVLIVLGKALFPTQAKIWGQAEPRGWKRAFVVAEQHPAWGADMAKQAGASPLVVNLIKNHQNKEYMYPQPGKAQTPEDSMLQLLQTIDDNH